MKKQEWSYKKSVARAEEAIQLWKRVTAETAQILYEERELLAKQKGQDKDEYAENYVPSWKDYCFEIRLPRYFERLLKKEWNSLIKFCEREKAAAKAKKKKRRGR